MNVQIPEQKKNNLNIHNPPLFVGITIPLFTIFAVLQPMHQVKLLQLPKFSSAQWVSINITHVVLY